MATQPKKVTLCPVGRADFDANAKNIRVTFEYTGIDGKPATQSLDIMPRQFQTGSQGWNANAKLAIPVFVNGKPILVGAQLGLNLTAIGSKELAGASGIEVQTIKAADVAMVPVGAAS